MAISNHEFDPRTAKRATKWLFTLASQYSSGLNRGPVGDCRPDEIKEDFGVIDLPEPTFEITDFFKKDAGIVELLEPSFGLSTHGFEFEEKVVPLVDENAGIVDLLEPSFGLSTHGFEFEEKVVPLVDENAGIVDLPEPSFVLTINP